MTDLARLLRHRTADLHEEVEQAVALPGSVRSRDDYVVVLRRFLDLHAPLEQQLARPAWAPRWAALGIDLAVHVRTGSLHDDLRRLGAPTRPGEAAVPCLAHFGEALGCLYVLEGSSLGGRVLAPALRSAAGDVPTGFFAGEGRQPARAWQAVRAALRRAPVELHDDAVAAARAVFTAFGTHLSRPSSTSSWRQTPARPSGEEELLSRASSSREAGEPGAEVLTRKWTSATT